MVYGSWIVVYKQGLKVCEQWEHTDMNKPKT